MTSTSMRFTAATDIYRLSPTAHKMDIIDQLNARQSQLEAMLAATYSDCGESFRGMPEARQDMFMWACADAAKEVGQLTKLLLEMRSASEEAA